jgi:hypothetical protein
MDVPASLRQTGRLVFPPPLALLLIARIRNRGRMVQSRDY